MSICTKYVGTVVQICGFFHPDFTKIRVGIVGLFKAFRLQL